MPRPNAQGKKILDDAVRSFVRDVLGCNCPDEVFESIGYDQPSGHPTGPIVTIGGRLIVRFIPFDTSVKDPIPFSRSIMKFLVAGRRMRDRKGYNRFRLVIVFQGGTGRYKRFIDETQRAFKGSSIDDGRAHLHFVCYTNVPLPIRKMLSF
jgi:hypothetical protein